VVLIAVVQILLLHAALLASPNEADAVRELARPAFMQPLPPAAPPPRAQTRAWLALASDLLVLLQGGTALELDAFLHGVAVTAEALPTHPQTLRACLAVCIDAARRFSPYFRDEGGFGLVLPHLVRTYQRHRHDPIITNGTRPRMVQPRD
jgi:hypothetical protein